MRGSDVFWIGDLNVVDWNFMRRVNHKLSALGFSNAFSILRELNSLRNT